MKLASFLQKIKNKNPKSLPAKDIFYMATKGGAKSLNYENVGELKKGNLADIIVLNTDNPNAKPIYDPYSFVVYSAQTRDVDKVIVNGEIQVDNGSLINSIKDYIVIAEKYKDEFIFNK
jgi:5-methylthioadenosine/S-adenosylhomocysteine deaminase